MAISSNRARSRRSLRATLAALVTVAALVASAFPAGAAVVKSTAFRLGAGMHARALTLGPDGNLWFGGTRTPFGENPVAVVGSITPSGAVAEYSLGIGRGESISSITPGPDGKLWFTQPDPHRIGQFTGGQFSGSTIGGDGSLPQEIVTDALGRVWVTLEGNDAIAHVEPFTEFSQEFQLGSGGSRPRGIAAGRNGAIWITEPGADAVAERSAEGAVRTFSLSSPDALPNSIAVGAGVAMFTEESGPRLGLISMRQRGTGVKSIDVSALGSDPTGDIVFGPAGDFWFTIGNRIASISPKGLLGEAACITAACDQPMTLAVGPEDQLWYATAVSNAYSGGGTGMAAASEPGTIGHLEPSSRRVTHIGRHGGLLRGRFTSVAIACRGFVAAAPCPGRLKISGRIPGFGSGGFQLLGTKGFELRVGGHHRVSIGLPRQAARQIRRLGGARLFVTVTVVGGESRHRTLAVHPPRR